MPLKPERMSALPSLADLGDTSSLSMLMPDQFSPSRRVGRTSTSFRANWGSFFFVDVLKRVKGFLSRSPAGNARRLFERVLRQRHHPIVPDRSGSGRCSSRCVPVRRVSLRNSVRLRHLKCSPAMLLRILAVQYVMRPLSVFAPSAHHAVAHAVRSKRNGAP